MTNWVQAQTWNSKKSQILQIYSDRGETPSQRQWGATKQSYKNYATLLPESEGWWSRWDPGWGGDYRPQCHESPCFQGELFAPWETEELCQHSPGSGCACGLWSALAVRNGRQTGICQVIKHFKLVVQTTRRKRKFKNKPSKSCWDKRNWSRWLYFLLTCAGLGSCRGPGLGFGECGGAAVWYWPAVLLRALPGGGWACGHLAGLCTSRRFDRSPGLGGSSPIW